MFYSVFFNISYQTPICRRAFTLEKARQLKKEGERDGFVVRIFDWYGNQVTL